MPEPPAPGRHGHDRLRPAQPRAPCSPPATTIAAVYTQPPRPAGRGHQLRRTPVHEAAERLGLEVRTPRTLKDAEAQAEFAALGADLAVVGAYGLLLPRPVLDAPRLGCINLHASLLPRWRGAAPIERAILAGDAETGISIFRMEEGLDTGPGLRDAAAADRPGDDRTGAARAAGGAGGRDAARASSPGIAAGTLPATPQPEDGRHLRPQARARRRPARLRRARRHDRAAPARAQPGSRLLVRGARRAAGPAGGPRSSPAPARRARSWRLPLTVACGDGCALRSRQVQRAGKRPMTPDELQRGFPLPVGTRARLSRCPATACCSNMTAARSRAGSARPTRPPSRARSRPPLLRLHRRGRRPSSPPAAPMPASTRWARSPMSTSPAPGCPSAWPARSTSTSARPDRRPGGARGAARLPRPLLLHRPPLPLPHPRPAAARRPWSAAASGTSRSPRRRAHARRGPGPGRPPRLHQLPLQRMPVGLAGEDAGRHPCRAATAS